MALFDQQTQYAGGYYAQQPDLQFYSGSPGVDPSAAFYPGARPSLEGNVVAGVGPGSGAPNFGGSIQPAGGWLSAFGTGGFEGEPPLLEGMIITNRLNIVLRWLHRAGREPVPYPRQISCSS
jgi:hypothetical protein